MGDCTCCYLSTCITSFFVAFILLFIFLYPGNPDIFIENALLTRFDLSSTPSNTKMVDYNLTVDVKLRNFNKQSRIQYYRLGVSAIIDGRKLASADLPVFRQDPKNTAILTAVMHGQTSLELSRSAVGFFQTAAEAGVLIVWLQVDGRLRFRTKGTRTTASSFDTDCGLSVVPFNTNVTAALSSPAKSGNGYAFSRVQCQYPQVD